MFWDELLLPVPVPPMDKRILQIQTEDFIVHPRRNWGIARIRRVQANDSSRQTSTWRLFRKYPICVSCFLGRSLAKKTKVLWLMLSVVLPYLIKKLSNYAGKQEDSFWKTLENVLIKVQKVINILSFVNYAVFILKGQYRTFVQRILRISMRFIS